jgi:hypothetical protein
LDSSIVQGPFFCRAVPNPSISRFATFSSPYVAARERQRLRERGEPACRGQPAAVGVREPAQRQQRLHHLHRAAPLRRLPRPVARTRRRVHSVDERLHRAALAQQLPAARPAASEGVSRGPGEVRGERREARGLLGRTVAQQRLRATPAWPQRPPPPRATLRAPPAPRAAAARRLPSQAPAKARRVRQRAGSRGTGRGWGRGWRGRAAHAAPPRAAPPPPRREPASRGTFASVSTPPAPARVVIATRAPVQLLGEGHKEAKHPDCVSVAGGVV